MNEPIETARIVFFDLETTGLDADCRIVQVAMIRGEKIFQSLVNPGIPIPPSSTEIHRITDKAVADAPKFEDIVDEVLTFIEGSILSGYNVRRFDVPVLKREVQRVGKEFPALQVIDVFELNQKMNPRTLAWFYRHYTGEPMDAEEAHDAVYDCICTRKGFLNMFDRHPEIPRDVDELTRFSEPERLPVADSEWLVWLPSHSEPCFAKGKYRGWPLSDVHRKEVSYLKWILSVDADSATKNLINLYIKDQDGYISILEKEHPQRLETKYLKYRHAMENNDNIHFNPLEELATKTNDPSLVFIAAAWKVKKKCNDAGEWCRKYLDLKDETLNANKRANFLAQMLKKCS